LRLLLRASLIARTGPRPMLSGPTSPPMVRRLPCLPVFPQSRSRPRRRSSRPGASTLAKRRPMRSLYCHPSTQLPN